MLDRRLGPPAAALSLLLLLAACGSDDEQGGDTNNEDNSEEQATSDEEILTDCPIEVTPMGEGGGGDLLAGVFYHPTEDQRLWEYDDVEDTAVPVEVIEAGERFCGNASSDDEIISTTEEDGNSIMLYPVVTPDNQEDLYVDVRLRASSDEESDTQLSADTEYLSDEELEAAADRAEERAEEGSDDAVEQQDLSE